MVITCDDLPDFLNEAGGHRWQEVSGKGKKAKVHTSTVTVSVLSTVEQKSTTRPDTDFDVKFFSGTGKGGQHRNRHQNSVRMTHLPSGLTQTAVGRLKQDNLDEARARLEELLDKQEARESHSAVNHVRAKQIGCGARGDKRRTYRFQEDQVYDQVTGKSTRCSAFLKGGIEALWS